MSCRATCPASATPTTSCTGRARAAAWSSAGTSSTRSSRWEDGVPWEHAARSLPPDYERFAPLMAGAVRRFPFLADAEVDPARLPPGRDDPGRQPAARAAARTSAGSGSRRGCRSTGSVAAAASAGRWPAGSRPATRASTSGRTGRGGSARRTATRRSPPALGRETYSDYYRLRYPFDADVAGRPRRLSPLHGRLQEAGAVFGTKAGWERADHHEPGRPWRRAGRDQATYGLDARRRGSTGCCDEGRAVRERVGIIDLSSFGKIDVSGPGALSLLQRVAANDLDRPVGSVVYTPWCDDRGGMVADVTVTRLADDRFRVVTGAGFVASDLAWLRWQRDPAERRRRLRDVSGDLATIGLWGPRARDVLAAAAGRTTSSTMRPCPLRAGPRRSRSAARPGPRVADQLRRRARAGS